MVRRFELSLRHECRFERQTLAPARYRGLVGYLDRNRFRGTTQDPEHDGVRRADAQDVRRLSEDLDALRPYHPVEVRDGDER